MACGGNQLWAACAVLFCVFCLESVMMNVRSVLASACDIGATALRRWGPYSTVVVATVGVPLMALAGDPPAAPFTFDAAAITTYGPGTGMTPTTIAGVIAATMAVAMGIGLAVRLGFGSVRNVFTWAKSGTKAK